MTAQAKRRNRERSNAGGKTGVARRLRRSGVRRRLESRREMWGKNGAEPQIEAAGLSLAHGRTTSPAIASARTGRARSPLRFDRMRR